MMYREVIKVILNNKGLDGALSRQERERVYQYLKKNFIITVDIFPPLSDCIHRLHSFCPIVCATSRYVSCLLSCSTALSMSRQAISQKLISLEANHYYAIIDIRSKHYLKWRHQEVLCLPASQEKLLRQWRYATSYHSVWFYLQQPLSHRRQ